MFKHKDDILPFMIKFFLIICNLVHFSGLAGPLHGLANQEVLVFLSKVTLYLLLLYDEKQVMFFSAYYPKYIVENIYNLIKLNI